MNQIYKLFYTRWPALSFTLVIFILLSLPGNDVPEKESIPYQDKYVHIILCGVHVWLWCVYLNARLKDKVKRNRLFFLVFLITCIYGVLMEYYQKYFVPNRDFEYKDMLADFIGAAIGWMVAKWHIKG